MAVNLSPASDGRFDFGDLAGVGNQGALSFSIILKPTAAVVDGSRVFHDWGVSGNELVFLAALADGDELGFVVSDGSFNFFGRKTTDLNLTNGTTYRIVITILFGSPPVIHIYVNGVDKSLVEFIGSSNVTQSIDSPGPGTVQVGHESRESIDGVEGDYSEFAIWQRVLSQAQADEFTLNNHYPYCCGPAGLLYLPMNDTTNLTDSWGGAPATLTDGSNATHPTMLACSGPSPFFTTVGSKRMNY